MMSLFQKGSAIFIIAFSCTLEQMVTFEKLILGSFIVERSGSWEGVVNLILRSLLVQKHVL